MNRAGNQKVQGIRMNALVAAGELISKADMVALNANGYAEKASVKENLTVIGIAVSDADNRMGSDGDEIVAVANGGYVFNQEGINQTDLLKTVYIKDAATVTLTATGSSVVGKIIEVDDTCATVLIQA